ncbi:hypothetical protein [Thiobacillus sp.]
MRSSQTGTTGRQTARRSMSSLRESVLETLKDDHKRVKNAFRDFEKIEIDPHEYPERAEIDWSAMLESTQQRRQALMDEHGVKAGAEGGAASTRLRTPGRGGR